MTVDFLAPSQNVEADMRLVGFFPKVIPSELCQKWIAAVGENDGRYQPVYQGRDGEQNVVDRTVRDVKLVPSAFADEIRHWIRWIITECVSPFYKVRMARWEDPQILRYEPGGFYTAHMDSEAYIDGEYRRVADRDYSLIVFLNTNFGGGGLDFPRQDLQIHPSEPGGAIVFPSDRRFPHGVHPVENGIRYSLVTWMTADRSAA